MKDYPIIVHHRLPSAGQILSAQAFDHVQPHLPSSRERVVEAISFLKRATANMVSKYLRHEYPTAPKLSNDNVRARISELRAGGLVIVTGHIEDPCSGEIVREYGMADDPTAIPVELKVLPSRAEMMLRIEQLERELDQTWQRWERWAKTVEPRSSNRATKLPPQNN